MSKLIIMKGLPASGKSTKAKEILEASGNAVRLNRDLLRTMLHFDKWTGKNEEITTRVQQKIALDLLDQDKVVIIDDTNLNPRVLQRWIDWVPEFADKYEVVDLTDVSYEECLRRDHQREKRVGDHVIIGMARQYGLYPFANPDVIVDIDGTLADITHRLHFVQRDPNISFDDSINTMQQKDWDGFFGAMADDAPRTDIINHVHELKQKGYNIVYVSGRPEQYRQLTYDWLIKVGMEWTGETLFMRKHGDRRPDTEVKQEILDKYFKKENVYKVIDDRPSVIRMWESNGLNVMDVGNGVEF